MQDAERAVEVDEEEPMAEKEPGSGIVVDSGVVVGATVSEGVGGEVIIWKSL